MRQPPDSQTKADTQKKTNVHHTHEPCKPEHLAEDGLRLLLQFVDDARVQKRGGVAQIGCVVLRDLPEDAAHDLAAASLGQSAREDDLVGLCKGPYGLPDGLLQLLLQCVV